MSSHRTGRRRIRATDLIQRKRAGERFSMLTAYDATTARILEAAGIDVLLVGDSVGDNVLGYDSTVPVALDAMLHHAAAVVRGTSRAMVVGDLPFGSYQVSADEGMRSAIRLLQESGVGAVKAEGAGTVVDLCARLVAAGIPFMGHLGLTPQSVNTLGYRVQGRAARTAERILRDAQALTDAGAFAIVLEAVPSRLAQEITAAVGVPTIGIGAGSGTDGQVLVTNDVLGLNPGPLPRFAKAYTDLEAQITAAVTAYDTDVRAGTFPDADHSYASDDHT